MQEEKYYAAEYLRYSYTDDKSTESDSIANQRKQIQSFVENQPDIVSTSEWVDDGVSGILFDRPAFKKMMAEIESGKVNCIIVKDLSRFGREYIETGRYLRRILPAYGVRFIAINDNIDTLRDSGDDLIVSVKSIMNDAYCRDISIKTRSAMNIKRINGDYVGACPVYGYAKDKQNRNQLVIDKFPASVVHDIFRMKLEGMSANKISEALNNLGVLSPIEFKKANGLPYPKNGYADVDGAKWSPRTVLRILSDETYTGTLVQGKQSTHNYKLKNLITKPKSEWKRVEQAHEAIISQHDFDLTQRIMRLDTRTAPGGDGVYLFSGILICDSCGARMVRKTVPYKDTKYHYYCCKTSKKRGCLHSINIKESDLCDTVTECIKSHIANIASIDTLLSGEEQLKISNAIAAQQLQQIAENEERLKSIIGFKTSLTENMIEGLISKNDYKQFKSQYTDDEKRLVHAISILKQQHEDIVTGKSERLRWVEHFRKFENISELDRRTVVSLIKSIRIIGKKQIHISFNFHLEYDNLQKVIQQEVA